MHGGRRLQNGVAAESGLRWTMSLDDVCPITGKRFDDLLDLNEALKKFAAANPKKAELVKLRFFAGLTVPASRNRQNHPRID